MGLLIRDGYTQTDEYKSQGHIPAFKFTYRPGLPERVYDYRAMDRSNGKAAIRESSKLIMEHAVSWNVTDDKNEPVAISVDVLKRVPAPAIDFMVACICGYGPDREWNMEDAAKNS